MSTVLDMCAAPGMKTTMLAAMLRGKGLVYAIERHERRHKDMDALVKMAGCDNVVTLHSDSLSLSSTSKWAKANKKIKINDVQYILVDPTCSGTGENIFFSV